MKKWVFAIGFFLLIAAVLLTVRRYSFSPQTIILKNGASMEFVDTSFGTNHQWDISPLWMRALALISRRFTAVGSQSASSIELTSKNSSLVLWEEAQNLPGASQNPEFAIEDENGNCSSSRYALNQSRTLPATSNSFGGFLFEAFPRRGKEFTIHVFEYNASWKFEKAGSIKVKNPAARSTFSEWKPETLPIVKNDGDLQVTLARLIANVSTENYPEPVPSTNKYDAGTLVSLKMLQNGVAATNWTLQQITFMDATGNVGENRSRRSFPSTNELVSIVDNVLWPDEPAWKMRMELSRESGFTADELVSFTNIPIAITWATSVVQSNTVGKRSIEMLAAVSYNQSSEEGRSRSYALPFHAKPGLEGYRFTVIQATDDRGHSLRTMGWGTSGNQYNVSLEGTNVAKSLNVTLAIHRSRLVEFLAKPDLLKSEPARASVP
jgi:hypothetical protein